MTKKTLQELQQAFRTGAVPTGQDFSDFIESTFNYIDQALIVQKVNSQGPDEIGNVQTSFQVIDALGPDKPMVDYPNGSSEFYYDYDPTDYAEYIADHPSMAQLQAGQIRVRTYHDESNGFAYQEVDNIVNGTFETGYVRIGEDNEWGELVVFGGSDFVPEDVFDNDTIRPNEEDVYAVYPEALIEGDGGLIATSNGFLAVDTQVLIHDEGFLIITPNGQIAVDPGSFMSPSQFRTDEHGRIVLDISSITGSDGSITVDEQGQLTVNGALIIDENTISTNDSGKLEVDLNAIYNPNEFELDENHKITYKTGGTIDNFMNQHPLRQASKSQSGHVQYASSSSDTSQVRVLTAGDTHILVNSKAYTLPDLDMSVVGHVCPDDTTIIMDDEGIISVAPATARNLPTPIEEIDLVADDTWVEGMFIIPKDSVRFIYYGTQELTDKFLSCDTLVIVNISEVYDEENEVTKKTKHMMMTTLDSSVQGWYRLNYTLYTYDDESKPSEWYPDAVKPMIPDDIYSRIEALEQALDNNE